MATNTGSDAPEANDDFVLDDDEAPGPALPNPYVGFDGLQDEFDFDQA